MKTNNRKKALRQINKVARKVNNAILHDDLWNGRFYMKQKSVSLHSYEDGSGMDGIVCYTFIDTKTGRHIDYWFRANDFTPPFEWHIFHRMNDFIVKDCKVWNEEPRPNKQPKTIYRVDNSLPKF